MNTIKTGDTIRYNPAWGSMPPVNVTVESMEVTDYAREKYGDHAEEVTHDLIRQNKVVFSLSDGHWCYGSQIELSSI
jgi:hypothetical protein